MEEVASFEIKAWLILQTTSFAFIVIFFFVAWNFYEIINVDKKEWNESLKVPQRVESEDDSKEDDSIVAPIHETERSSDEDDIVVKCEFKQVEVSTNTRPTRKADTRSSSSSSSSLMSGYFPLNVSVSRLLEMMENGEDENAQAVIKDGESARNFLWSSEDVKRLEEGDVMFYFACKGTLDCAFEEAMVRDVVNLTSFEDETRDNWVPHFVHSEDNPSNLAYILTKTAFLIPNVNIDQLCDPAFMSTPEYSRECQPVGTYVWTDVEEENTFRITKPVIPLLYSVKVQFKVSRIRSSDLPKLSLLVGATVQCGLLLERTKRSVPPKQDRTRKAKCVLLFTEGDAKGSVIMTNLTVIVQSGFPRVAQGIVHRLGSLGQHQAIETAVRTRRYLRKKIPGNSSL